MTVTDLQGRNILVVEDEYVIAAELTGALGKAGASVLGPVSTVGAALDLLAEDEDPDAAVLDVNLDGEMVYPVADALLARNIPFVFASGYDRRFLPERHAAVHWLEKPLEQGLLLREVGGLLGRGPQPADATPYKAQVGHAPVGDSRNRLLGLLSSEDRALLLPHCERVILRRADVIAKPSVPVEHVHFLEGGMASVIAGGPEDGRIEVGCVGREGLAEASAILGVEQSPYGIMIQIGGAAVRIALCDLLDAMEKSRTLRTLLLRYVHVYMTQLAATALADGRYQIEARLARWLLMAQDRVGGSEVHLTHELLALMLGVRRPGVTDAIHILEGEGILKATRGRIFVRDRSRLEAVAGASYGVPEAEYRRVIGGTVPNGQHAPASAIRINGTRDRRQTEAEMFAGGRIVPAKD